MIIISLSGGLGNQMFQYALGRALSLRNNCKLRIDTSWYNNIPSSCTSREFELNNYNIVGKKHSNRILGMSKNNHLVKRLLPEAACYSEKSLIYDEKVLELSGHHFLKGYWQSYKYFEGIRDKLINDFRLKYGIPDNVESLREEVISNNQSVSIHIRRGDMVHDRKTREYHGHCTIDYFQRAIALIEEKFSSPHFYLFSDEIDWAMENFSYLNNKSFISCNLGIHDLEVMKHCHHNIISNSSFSWWAAWLNVNPDKIVICPLKWYKTDISDVDLIPETWERI